MIEKAQICLCDLRMSLNVSYLKNFIYTAYAHLHFLGRNLNSAENPGNRFEKGIAKCPQAKSEYLS